MQKHQIKVLVPKEVVTTQLVEETITISNGVRVALQLLLFPHSGGSNKVGAIHVLRSELGIGLKEAKDIVCNLRSIHLEK